MRERVQKIWNIISTTAFSILVGTSWFFILLSALPIFAQLIHIPDVNKRIWDVVLVGFPYLVTSVAFFVCWVQRRYMLSYRLDRIPRSSLRPFFQQQRQRGGGQTDVPQPVLDLINREYLRTSLISYHSQPLKGRQPGWGAVGADTDANNQIGLRVSNSNSNGHGHGHGTGNGNNNSFRYQKHDKNDTKHKYEGQSFRSTFLNAVEKFDNTAKELLPSLPPFIPQTLTTLTGGTTRLSTRYAPFRGIVVSEESLWALDEMDAIMQIAVYREPEVALRSRNNNNNVNPHLNAAGVDMDGDAVLAVEEEMTEEEFERGMAAVEELQLIFDREKEILGSDYNSVISMNRSYRSNRSINDTGSMRSIKDRMGYMTVGRSRSQLDVSGSGSPNVSVSARQFPQVPSHQAEDFF